MQRGVPHFVLVKITLVSDATVNLEAINAFAQLIAALGVIVSLFYLAAQIRQNTRSTRAVVVDSLTHALVDLLAQHTQNPELLRSFATVIENWGDATENDRERAVPFIFATFKLFENAWFQQRQARWIDSNGKVGMLTFAPTIVGLV